DPYLLNFDTTPNSFNLTVQVTDDQGASATATFTVNLTNVTETDLQVNSAWSGPSFVDGTTVTGTDSMSHTIGIDAFGSIQAAIAQADASGTTIHVAAGTYSDPFTLSKFVTLDTVGAVTVTGAISGNDGLAKAGTGTLTLTQVDSYTGGTNVKAGTLLVSAD